MTLLLKRLWPEERGQGVSEYALLLVLLVLAAVTTMGDLAARVDNVYSDAGTHVKAAAAAAPLAGASLRYTAQGPADRQAQSNGTKEQKPDN